MSRATMRVAGHRRRKLHQTEAGPQFSRFDQGGSAVRWSAKLSARSNRNARRLHEMPFREGTARTGFQITLESPSGLRIRKL